MHELPLSMDDKRMHNNWQMDEYILNEHNYHKHDPLKNHISLINQYIIMSLKYFGKHTQTDQMITNMELFKNIVV